MEKRVILALKARREFLVPSVLVAQLDQRVSVDPLALKVIVDATA